MNREEKEKLKSDFSFFLIKIDNNFVLLHFELNFKKNEI